MWPQLLLLAGLGLLVAAALAPFEALTWWARQDPAGTRAAAARLRELTAGVPTDEDPHPAWVVYLTGVGAVGADINPIGERPFLDDLAAALPRCGFVSDIYPWDVANRGLLRGRGSAWFWRTVQRLSRTRWLRLAQVLVYLRNLLQFAVCADDRYGPVYSLGIAGVVLDRLVAAGYEPSSRRPVVLLGWSGGAQIAVATASFLSAAGLPVYVVSMGGVVTSDPGLDGVRHLWHLRGSRDHVQALGRLFPGRWPGRRHSHWATAVADGRISDAVIGDQRHLGRGSYLSRAVSPDGRRYREISVAEVAGRVATAVRLDADDRGPGGATAVGPGSAASLG